MEVESFTNVALSAVGGGGVGGRKGQGESAVVK